MRVFFIFLIAFSLLAAYASAAMDHKQVLTGPYKTGEEVTQMCVMCHDKQASDFMKTSHWKWKGPVRMFKAKDNLEYGKANLFNSFCVNAVEESLAFCARCHSGYGMNSYSFDLKDKSKIDCLVCHATEGNYKKSLSGLVDNKLIESGKMDLLKAAQSVGKPNRENCGVCHFFGGGGDAVKHGDLDSTLSKPKKEQDVHMGGMDFSCQGCHVTKEHRVSGGSTFLATNEGRISCEDCHKDGMEPHKKSQAQALLLRHTRSLACQTCHIPSFARGQATKMSWDWSTAGKDIEPKEQEGKKTFDKAKGTFVWAKEVTPVYSWYNGQVDRYLMGDKIADMKKTLPISKPRGDISSRYSKIYPFKAAKGKQPADSKYKYLLPFQTYNGLWKDYDWQKAIATGAKSRNIAYSGSYEFVNTIFYGSINHEVAPKEKVLKCRDCHFGSKRFDWKALGYSGDPMSTGGRFANNLVKDAQEKKSTGEKETKKSR